MKTTNIKLWEKRATIGLTLRLIIVVSTLLILTSCEHTTPPIKKVPNYCPPPVINMHGEWKMPYPRQAYQRASYNSEKLIFRSQNEAFILNLKTGVVSYLDIQSKLPSNVILSSAYRFYWCPYDNNRVLIHASTATDLLDDTIKRYYYGKNLYIITLDGSELKEVKRVTPSIFDPAGATDNFSIYSWLPESKENSDFIRMSYVINGIGYRNKYLIQEDKMFDANENYYFRAISKDGKYLFSFKERNANNQVVWSINGNEFVFNEEFQFLDYSSFSPSGKYLALSVTLYPGTSEEERRYNEIWIINVEKFLSKKPEIVTPDKIINLRHDFCMYAMASSPCAEFISETELAVAMYEDGDDVAYLWKVSIDGKLLGQLTFEP